MTIKNISGAEKVFTFSNLVSNTVANNAQMVVPDSPECVADALRYAALGLIEIVEGTPSAQLVQSTSQPERIIFTSTGQPDDGETIVFEGVTFEFDDDDTVEEDNVAVEIGGDEAATLTNLLAAIEAHADLAGYLGRGVIDDGTNTIAAVSLPDGVAVADITVDTDDVAATSHYEEALEAGSSLVHVVLVRTVVTVAPDLIFSTNMSQILDAQVSVYNSSYVPVAWDGNVHIKRSTGGGLIVLDNDGDVDIAAGHTIVIQALGKA